MGTCELQCPSWECQALLHRFRAAGRPCFSTAASACRSAKAAAARATSRAGRRRPARFASSTAAAAAARYSPRRAQIRALSSRGMGLSRIVHIQFARLCSPTVALVTCSSLNSASTSLACRRASKPDRWIAAPTTASRFWNLAKD